jgi:hypothetical protein
MIKKKTFSMERVVRNEYKCVYGLENLLSNINKYKILLEQFRCLDASSV